MSPEAVCVCAAIGPGNRPVISPSPLGDPCTTKQVDRARSRQPPGEGLAGQAFGPLARRDHAGAKRGRTVPDPAPRWGQHALARPQMPDVIAMFRASLSLNPGVVWGRGRQYPLLTPPSQSHAASGVIKRCKRVSRVLRDNRRDTVRLRGIGTGISEAGKRVPILPFATQRGKQESSYFDRGTRTKPEGSEPEGPNPTP